MLCRKVGFVFAALLPLCLLDLVGARSPRLGIGGPRSAWYDSDSDLDDEWYYLPSEYTSQRWFDKNRKEDLGIIGWPPSDFIFYSIPFIVDVEPFTIDLSGLSYLVTLYRTEPFVEPGSKSSLQLTLGKISRLFKSKKKKTPIIRKTREGPFKIRPLSDLDAILRVASENQSDYVSQVLGRPAMDFKVVQRGFLWKLPRMKKGSAWLAGAELGVAMPSHWIFKSGARFAIDAIPDETDHRGRTALVTVYTVETIEELRKINGEESVDRSTPWRMRPMGYQDNLNFFNSDQQPEWVTKLLARPNLPLQDFSITGPDDEKLKAKATDETSRYAIYGGVPGSKDEASTSHILVKSYTHQCMQADVGYFLDFDSRTYPIKERFVVTGIVRTYGVPSKDEIAGDDVLYPSSHTHLAPADAIEVSIQGRDRVIAQSVLTDHIEFQFDVPLDARGSPNAGLFSVLMFCIFGGSSDLRADLSKSPY